MYFSDSCQSVTLGFQLLFGLVRTTLIFHSLCVTLRGDMNRRQRLCWFEISVVPLFVRCVEVWTDLSLCFHVWFKNTHTVWKEAVNWGQVTNRLQLWLKPPAQSLLFTRPRPVYLRIPVITLHAAEFMHGMWQPMKEKHSAGCKETHTYYSQGLMIW